MVGCEGSAPTAISEAPAATSAPEQAAATATPEPPPDTPTSVPPTPTSEPPTDTPTPEPPTATPTPEPPTVTPTPAAVDPQPGTTLTGDVEESQNVSGAIVSLEISEDGASITTVTIGLLGPGECGGVTLAEGGTFNSFVYGPFPITEGGDFDISLPNGGELKGQFTSPTEASGTIKVVGLDFVASCKFGPSNWSAKVE